MSTHPFKVDYLTDDEPSVFYACYGSNLYGACFMEYMNQGRERAERLDENRFETYRVTLPHNIYFSKFEVGHGAAAFLDVDAPGAALGRIWRISYAQFTTLALSESRAPYQNLPWEHILSCKHTYLDVPGHYGRITHLGEVKGTPVYTVTSPLDLVEHREQSLLEAPLKSYSDIIVAGAMETMLLPYRHLKP